MAEVVMCLESIRALLEKTDSTLHSKLSGRRVPRFLFPFNWKNLVGGTSLKSLDRYLCTVGGEDRTLRRFDFNTIVYATENFSEANKFDNGSYASMYKGQLQNGHDITIAQYSEADYYECKIAVSTLVKLEHENAIQLLGYCVEGTSVYLIFDNAVNATLHSLIFDPMCNLLDWNKRCKIILDVARVLVYLHDHAPIRIIHRDVRPSNILLDESFDPKLSDFGIAIAIYETEGIQVDQIVGTYEYMAPEYVQYGDVSAKKMSLV